MSVKTYVTHPFSAKGNKDDESLNLEEDEEDVEIIPVDADDEVETKGKRGRKSQLAEEMFILQRTKWN